MNSLINSSKDEINPPPNEHHHLRKIKSFMIRNGRFTQRQQFAVQNYFPQFGIEFQQQKLNFAQIFANSNPVVVEIGYGMGRSLIQMAQNNPQINYLGIEVHLPGVGNTLMEIKQQNLDNIRLIVHDGVEVLEKMIADDSLSGVQLFFPDPWPKARHHKRRIINQQFLSIIIPKIKTQGFIHLATDWENYAQWMLNHLQQRNELINTALVDYIPRPAHRPLTKFESFGQNKNHQIFDLYFIKK